MKKIISAVLFFSMMFSSFGEGFALASIKMNTIQKNLDFSSKYLKDLGNGTVQVQFQDITEKNAGTVVASWKETSNFPKRFLLDKGLSVKIDMNEVNKKLLKMNTVKSNKDTYTKKGINVGNISSELRMLPDRLELYQNVELSYESDDQIALIRKDLFGGSGVLSDLDLLKQKKLKPINERGLGDAELKKTGLSGLKVFPNTQNDLDALATKSLIQECISQNRLNAKTACTEEAVLKKLKSAKKHITVEEKVEFLLIPPNTLGGDFDFAKKPSSEVRITKKQIQGVFENYAIANTLINTSKNLSPEITGTSDSSNPLDASDYCEKHYTVTTSKTTVSGESKVSSKKMPDPSVNLKSTSDVKISLCKDLQKKKNTLSSEVYTKNLLNGFTLGEANSYEWGSELKVDLWIKTVTLYSISARVYYSYGFGVRIPIEARVALQDSVMDNAKGSDQDLKIRIGLKTLDGNEGFYSGVGLEKGKIFAGKEFVLEVSAGIEIHGYIIGLGSMTIDIGLIRLLAEYFKDILVKDLGIPESMIKEVINSNKIDESRNFTPPFAGSDTVSLLDASVTVPIYSIGIASVLARLIIKSGISGDIKFDCHNVFVTGGCGDQKVKFAYDNVKTWDQFGSKWGLTKKDIGENLKWQEYTATAFYNEKGAKSDALASYQNFGVILDNFQYIPTLLVELFVQGGIHLGLPYIGGVDLWTPEIKIFSMEFSTDALALGTHDGTDGTFDATKNNRIYGIPKTTLLTGVRAISTGVSRGNFR